MKIFSGTSLRLSPSGSFLWAGFSDGTLRVFDLTGQFGLEQDKAVASRQKSSLLVASKWCQTFGAVACQIHARGVHTDLLTHVDVCGDYVFCGVSRGAMELNAVCMKDLEVAASSFCNHKLNILDYLQVHNHADAKLKGFGAATKLINTSRPTYLLLTGKGIKNIHIWSFQPPISTNEEAIWTQLYDTQTNGNTINLLGFYRSNGKLLGVSKSDTQKLRLWDLSEEEQKDSDKKERSKRPPYVDVANSQAALGLASGGFCVCGGPTMYNQLSIVSLDQPNNAFNHTELALPSTSNGGSRRQRRGDLKQVVNVASPPEEDKAGQLLLELDDGSIVQYTMKNKGTSPTLSVLQPPTIPALPADFWRRTICLASSASSSSLVVVMSLYNPNTQQGQMILRNLGTSATNPASPLQADRGALQALMQAPPSSAFKTPKQPNIKKKNKKRKEATVSKKKSDALTPKAVSAKKQKAAEVASTPNEEIHLRKVRVIPISASTSKKKSKKERAKLLMETPTLKKPKATDSVEKASKHTEAGTTNSSLQQVSPDQASAVKPAPSAPTGAMDTFVVKKKKQAKKESAGVRSPLIPRRPRACKENYTTPDPGMKRPRTPPPTESLKDCTEDYPTLEEIMASRAGVQYKHIEQLIKALPPHKPAFLRRQQKSLPFANIEKAQEHARNLLVDEHRAAHLLIRRRMLQAAQSTLRSVLESHITVEDARTELKSTLDSYQGIVVSSE